MKRVLAGLMSAFAIATFGTSPVEAQTASCPPEVAKAKEQLSMRTAKADTVQAPRSLAGAPDRVAAWPGHPVAARSGHPEPAWPGHPEPAWPGHPEPAWPGHSVATLARRCEPDRDEAWQGHSVGPRGGRAERACAG